MRGKCYNKFKQIISIELSEICKKFSIYALMVEKRAKEERASKCSWAGYESVAIISNFKNELDNEIDVYLNKILYIFEKLDRKLSAKQIKEIANMSVDSFQIVVEQFKKKLPDIIGDVPETIKSKFNGMPNNIMQKVNKSLELMNFVKANRYDRYFFWTIFANIIAAGSLVATILISILTQ